VRRKVFLKNKLGEHLLYAISLWNISDYDTFLPDKKKAIGTNLSNKNVEYFREILTTAEVKNPDVKEVKALVKADFDSLARGYFMHNGGRPITYIEEIFLPDLKKYF
jgi:chorismate-pyruvate lyase